MGGSVVRAQDHKVSRDGTTTTAPLHCVWWFDCSSFYIN
jgi:hypothetical protein